LADLEAGLLVAVRTVLEVLVLHPLLVRILLLVVVEVADTM
jgi:hypothetical protein